MRAGRTLVSAKEVSRFDDWIGNGIDRLKTDIINAEESGINTSEVVNFEDVEALGEVMNSYRTSNQSGVENALATHSDVAALASYCHARFTRKLRETKAYYKQAQAVAEVSSRASFTDSVDEIYDTLVEGGVIKETAKKDISKVKQTEGFISSLVQLSEDYKHAEVLLGFAEELYELSSSLLGALDQRKDCLIQMSINSRKD